MSESPKHGWRPGAAKKERIDALAASGVTVSDAGTVDEKPGVSLIASAWKRLRRDRIFLLGLAITIIFVLVAIFAPLIAPHDPTKPIPELIAWRR